MRGFTLIELMVVIAIIAVLVVIAVPSYTQYNNNQTLNEAANQMQTVIRQAQNNAQTGTVCKISGGTSKATNWYVDISEDSSGTLPLNTYYSFSPTCESGIQAAQQTTFPKGVSITDILFRDSPTDTGCSPLNAQVIFSNISSGITLLDKAGAIGCPDAANRYVEITLSLSGSGSRVITVEKGGAIYVKQ